MIYFCLITVRKFRIKRYLYSFVIDHDRDYVIIYGTSRYWSRRNFEKIDIEQRSYLNLFSFGCQTLWSVKLRNNNLRLLYWQFIWKVANYFISFNFIVTSSDKLFELELLTSYTCNAYTMRFDSTDFIDQSFD